MRLNFIHHTLIPGVLYILKDNSMFLEYYLMKINNVH